MAAGIAFAAAFGIVWVTGDGGVTAEGLLGPTADCVWPSPPSPLVRGNRVIAPRASRGGGQRKVVDAIHVAHEIDVLVTRFEEYARVVDEFHVFEGNLTQRGAPKPLVFCEHRQHFQKYWDRIRYHRIPNLEGYEHLCGYGTIGARVNLGVKGSAWACEVHDREYVETTMLELLEDDDIVIHSDADEVIRESTLRDLTTRTLALPVVVNLTSYKYSLHWLEYSAWIFPTVMTGRQARLKLKGLRPTLHRHIYTGLEIVEGGWHLSTFGSLEDVQRKVHSIIEGYSREMSNETLLSRLHLGVALYNSWTSFSYRPQPPEPPPRIFHTMSAYANKRLMRWDRIGAGRADTTWCKLLGYVDPWGYCSDRHIFQI